MAEEEIVAPDSTPVPAADHKRKLEDVEPEAPVQSDQPGAEIDGVQESDAAPVSDASEPKRPRLEDKIDALEASKNGFHADKSEEQEEKEEGSEKPVKEEEEVTDLNKQEDEHVETPADINKEVEDVEGAEANDMAEGVDEQSTVVQDAVKPTETEAAAENSTDKLDNVDTGETQLAPPENISENDNIQEPALDYNKQIDEIDEETPSQEAGEPQTRRIDVPSSKVGVLIGKGGDTIRYLQYNSGAKIQIMRDADADQNAVQRPVEIIGSQSSIEQAEKLIKAVIAEADAGGTPSLVARGLPTTQATGGVAESIEIQVPNEKVGLIIGRGGETIKNMQAKSGARIQLIPQHLPEGDGSKERTVRVSGDRRDIDTARELIKDVMNQTIRPSSFSGNYNQPAYRSHGPPQYAQRGPHPSQPMGYDHQHRGPYAPQKSHFHPPSYGNYPPQHSASRGGYGSGWEQRPHSIQGPPPHSSGYDYYGGQGGHSSVPHPTPGSGHAPGPLPSSGMGPPSSQTNYNYGQPHGPEYGHPAPYSQNAPHQSYGHMYEEPKYDNHAPMQQPYSGHGGSQSGYPQPGGHPGYPAQQQQGKPLQYGMQGPPPQTYGPSRGTIPGDMPYQGLTQSAQQYGPTVGASAQQQYPYASGGPVQQTYPSYGSAPLSDGYAHPQSAVAPTYPGGQTAATYNQPAGYAQVGSTTGYGSYPSSQQGYPEQQPAQVAGGYYAQASQDPNYGGSTGAVYGTTPSAQSNYAPAAQTTAGQPGYDQSASAGYVATPVTAPVPQPGYQQYDASQAYAAPR